MKVVVAFIEKESKILITRRALNTHWGGYWELPGGKLESCETPDFALTRELKEELNIQVESATLMAVVEQNNIDFYLYHVHVYTGDLKLSAGQINMTWVNFEELNQYSFPDTNQQFFEIWKSK